MSAFEADEQRIFQNAQKPVQKSVQQPVEKRTQMPVRRPVQETVQNKARKPVQSKRKGSDLRLVNWFSNLLFLIAVLILFYLSFRLGGGWGLLIFAAISIACRLMGYV
jgi:Fe2+ transport system protein B